MEDIQNLVESRFKLFDPQTPEKDILPEDSGNQIIVLRNTLLLPKDAGSITLKYKGIDYKVIYIGHTTNLRERYAVHFTGNDASRSTLRKSLGSLRGFKKVPRDKNNPGNKKTKFSDHDEEELSSWMKDNLLLFYYSNPDYIKLKQKLIDFYNPPLNLQNNNNLENLDYRERLSELRNKKG